MCNMGPKFHNQPRAGNYLSQVTLLYKQLSISDLHIETHAKHITHYLNSAKTNTIIMT